MTNNNQPAVVARVMDYLFKKHRLQRFHLEDVAHPELIRLASKRSLSELEESLTPPPQTISPPPPTISPPPPPTISPRKKSTDSANATKAKRIRKRQTGKQSQAQRRERSSPSSVFAGGDKQQPNGVALFAAHVTRPPPAKRNKFWTKERIIEKTKPLPESFFNPLLSVPTTNKITYDEMVRMLGDDAHNV